MCKNRLLKQKLVICSPCSVDIFQASTPNPKWETWNLLKIRVSGIRRCVSERICPIPLLFAETRFFSAFAKSHRYGGIATGYARHTCRQLNIICRQSRRPERTKHNRGGIVPRKSSPGTSRRWRSQWFSRCRSCDALAFIIR